MEEATGGGGGASGLQDIRRERLGLALTSPRQPLEPVSLEACLPAACGHLSYPWLLSLRPWDSRISGRCARSLPPTMGGFSAGRGPSLGSRLLSAHLGYRTSLLTGLPAFSLSPIQLLLHTAARVNFLKQT